MVILSRAGIVFVTVTILTTGPDVSVHAAGLPQKAEEAVGAYLNHGLFAPTTTGLFLMKNVIYADTGNGWVERDEREGITLWRNFLVAKGYLRWGKVGPVGGGWAALRPHELVATEKLRPFISQEGPDFWRLGLLKATIKSVDKLERVKRGDLGQNRAEGWRFLLTFQVTPTFPEIPVRMPPSKAHGIALFDQMLERWGIEAELLDHTITEASLRAYTHWIAQNQHA